MTTDERKNANAQMLGEINFNERTDAITAAGHSINDVMGEPVLKRDGSAYPCPRCGGTLVYSGGGCGHFTALCRSCRRFQCCAGISCWTFECDPELILGRLRAHVRAHVPGFTPQIDAQLDSLK